jgi:heterodisulfide reductase subunit C
VKCVLSDVDETEVRFISMMLTRLVEEMNATVCEQCGKCASGCPVSRHMEDFNPRRIIAKISLGRMEEILESKVIWTCTSCMKCMERCPENISPYDVILVLRNLTVRAGLSHPESLDKTIDAVVENGVTRESIKLRTRTGELHDRGSLGLRPMDKPQDMGEFREALLSILKAGKLR